ncbi:hypothetical protein [Salinispira pacifica]|uniref:Uncharacterized protein n=1 Tax=Salinispira pacifica TaxID=1307761 RepID=V5WIM2_9SPIO|nr:hypothetical protein [Salinispira pacifica]AHC15475.1 hypothetical protein L21SP2_2108 [Salinispira pacifica]
MNILIVSPEPSDRDKLQNLLRDFQRDDVHLFQYFHPLKAIDNLDEIAPDYIFWSVTDFPLHWKTCIPICRETPELEHVGMILYSGQQIESKEQDKAAALAVIAIIQQGLDGPETPDVLTEILPRRISEAPATGLDLPYTGPGGEPAAASLPGEYRPSQDEPITLLMTHPLSLKLLKARVLELSPDYLCLSGLGENDLKNLPSGCIFKGCRLKIRDYRITLDLRLGETGTQTEMLIQEPGGEYLQVLHQLLHVPA